VDLIEQVVLFLTPGDPSERSSPPQTPGGPPVFDIVDHYTLTDDGYATNQRQRLVVPDLLDQIHAARRDPAGATP
jgi:hypothetical protein